MPVSEGTGTWNRRHERQAIRTDALVTLLYQELTFAPFTVRAVAVDVSMAGLRVRSTQLQEKDRLRLNEGPRYAEIAVDLPYLKEPLKARARVCWAKDANVRPGEAKAIELGLEFVSLPDAESHRLSFAVERLRADSFKSGTHDVGGIVPKRLK